MQDTNTPNRNIDIIFFCGEAGLGKTDFAKKLALSMNKKIYLSSSSNDPMQDYKGEEILVLDDMSDSFACFTDFIKMLDPFNNTSIKSRYCNRFFTGDTIILSSNVPIES